MPPRVSFHVPRALPVAASNIISTPSTVGTTTVSSPSLRGTTTPVARTPRSLFRASVETICRLARSMTSHARVEA